MRKVEAIHKPMTLLQQRMRHQTSVNANDRTSHERLIRRDSTSLCSQHYCFPSGEKLLSADRRFVADRHRANGWDPSF